MDKPLLLQEAEFPIFDNQDDPKVRAICAVAMGCDVWPRGIKSCGPSAIKKQLDSLSASDKNQAMSLVTNLLKTYNIHQAINHNVICCYVDAFQYEKSTIYGYIHGCNPETIESYLTDFASKDTTIHNTIKVQCCVGVMSGNSHCFIEAEGSLKCSSCSSVICQFCSGSHDKPLAKATDISTVICFSCYRGDTNDDEIVEETEMRNDLEDYHVQVPATATFGQVLKLYNERVVEKKYHLFDNSVQLVKYPLEPA